MVQDSFDDVVVFTGGRIGGWRFTTGSDDLKCAGRPWKGLRRATLTRALTAAPPLDGGQRTREARFAAEEKLVR